MGFTFFLAVLEDAFYAALAGIGFASISNDAQRMALV